MGQRAANSNRAPQASADGAKSIAERAVWIASDIADAVRRVKAEVANSKTAGTEEGPINYPNIFNTERGTSFIDTVECNCFINRGSDWPAVAAVQTMFVSVGGMFFASSNQSRLSALSVGQGVYLLSAGGKAGSASLTATSGIGRRQNRVSHRKPTMRTSNILLLCWGVSSMLLMTPHFAHSASPIRPADIEQAITDIQAGSDLVKADLVRNLIELGNRQADEAAKIQSLDSFIRLGAAVLKTRERYIDANAKVGIWPTFDALAHGAKFPVFAGTDPAAITDENLRKAYEDALARHKETLVSLSKERQKDEVASEALAACKRLLKEMNTSKADERVKQSLAKLADDPWLAARVAAALYPPAESNSGEAKPIPDGRDASSSHLPPTMQPSAWKKSVEAKHQTSSPGEVSTSSTPCSIIVVLVTAASGLLWLLLKRRS